MVGEYLQIKIEFVVFVLRHLNITFVAEVKFCAPAMKIMHVKVGSMTVS